MTAGLIQLVAYGAEDVYLTNNPQITFFKIVYRRHTNFTIEAIPQYFSTNPNFGVKSSCLLSKNGDLIHKIHLIIDLPQIFQFINDDGTDDEITKIAWAKKIGYKIITTIEIEIGGQVIDKQYGEWLYILNELTGPVNKGMDEMIGNIKNMYYFSNKKDAYRLYIPLQFWFCRYAGMALPIVAMRYSDVKINLELAQLEKCVVIGPTHCINIIQDLVCYEKYEYIEQTINGTTASGQFIYYDSITQTLYYRRIKNIFRSYTSTNSVPTNNILNDTYKIIGKKSNFITNPQPDTNESVHNYNNDILSLSITQCFLLVDYIFLDTDERLKFSQIKHEYLIEQIYVSDFFIIEGTNRTVKLNTSQLCKFVVFVGSQTYLLNTYNNDDYNYTDNYMIIDDKYIGKNLINSATILFNGLERISFRDSKYFNWVQNYQNFIYSSAEGINIYSFSIHPDTFQVSGACNLSKIDNISLRLNMNHLINFSNTSTVRMYTSTYNILRIIYGVCGLVFSQ